MKKVQEKLIKKRLCIVARALTCASFAVLVLIGVSSLVRAMSLETIENENGVPMIWKTSSTSNPDSITLPITYWDQKADPCDDPNRQFEWQTCHGYHTHGVVTGMVKSHLGSDRLPVPSFTSSEGAWQAHHDALSDNVTGHDPVLPTDNFYRWFHEVPGSSKRVNGRTVTFNRTADETYVYGGQHIYPIDDVPGLDASDIQLKGALGNYHNFNFTAHLGFAIKVKATGEELFEFSGDDDVWVFLNNQLVLDIGGLHGPISGKFSINSDGTVNTFVEKVNDLSIRNGNWVECMRIRNAVYAGGNCINNFNVKIRENFKNVTSENLDFGLKVGDVVNLDFFYAERSTDGSNTKITINNMDWPISADSKIDAKVVGKLNNTEHKLVEFNTNVKNRDPENPLLLERLAAYIREDDGKVQNEGYLPLDQTTLWYTTTPEDDKSWQPVEISAPDNSDQGFILATPIQMTPAGQPGSTLYFKYYGETSERPAGKMSSTISYYTKLGGHAGITYAYDEATYDETTVPPTNPNPDTPDPDNPDPNPENPDPDNPNPDNPHPEVPENPDPTPPAEDLPNIPTRPGDNIIDGELPYLPPLGEIAFVPNTGLIKDVVTSLFSEDFTEVIASQWFVLVVLSIFAGSFAVFFSLRKFLTFNPAVRTASAKSNPASKSVKSAVRAQKSQKAQNSLKSQKTTAKSSSKPVKKPVASPKSTPKARKS